MFKQKRILTDEVTYEYQGSPYRLHFLLGSWHIHILQLLPFVQAAGDKPQLLGEVANGNYISEPGNQNILDNFL